MDSIISQTELVVAFERDPQVRRRIFEFEDELAEQFIVPFSAINLPDSYDPSFPRIEALSHGGHSTLQISQNSLIIQTKYDHEFSDKPEEIKKYLSQRFEKVKNQLRKDKIQYFGFVIELLYYLEKDKINDFLALHTGFSSISEETIDFAFTVSIPFRGNYYLILSASKFVENVIPLSSEVSGESESESRYGIRIRLDINTKQSHHRGDKFEEQDYDRLFEILFGVISESSLADFLSCNLK